MGSQPTWTTAFPLVEMIIVKTNTTRWAKAQDTILSEKKKKRKKAECKLYSSPTHKDNRNFSTHGGAEAGGKEESKEFHLLR